MKNNENNELYHHGVKGQKWGVIRETDSEKTRLASEKENLKYQYQTYEAKRFYDNQNKKDKLDYKRDVKIARFGKQIEKGRQYTDRAIQRNITIGQIHKYRALSTAAVAAALSASSIGKSYAMSKAYNAGSDIYISNDNRHHNTNTQSWANTNSKNTTTTASDHSKIKFKHSDLETIGDTLVSDIFDNNSLEHHGIKDMRWGIRRFQNPDGSLTDEGKLRYLGADTIKKSRTKELTPAAYEALEKNPNWNTLNEKEKENAKKNMDKQIKEQVDNEIALMKAKQKMMADKDAYAIATVETGKQVIDGVSDVFEQTAKLVPNVPGKSSHPDYSDISTEELKKRTDRLNAEIAYAKASGEMKYTPSNEEKHREKLQTIGAVAGILATVGGIVIPLVKLKHHKGAGGGD